LGHSYAFYSLAIDNVGQRQLTPAVSVSTQIVSHVWHNYANPYDVDGLGHVEPLDVLMIINWINAHPGVSTPPAPPAAGPPYYDVNADDLIAPQDVLLVVNYINSHSAAAGEGEAGFGLEGAPLLGLAAPAATSHGLAPTGASVGPVVKAASGAPSRPRSSETPIRPVRLLEDVARADQPSVQPHGWTDDVWDDWDVELDRLDGML
jgi:hypothetical protein